MMPLQVRNSSRQGVNLLLTQGRQYGYRPEMDLSTYLNGENLSAADFARRINVSRSAVGRWMNGERVPSSEVMRRIRDATGGVVQPNDFFTDEAAA